MLRAEWKASEENLTTGHYVDTAVPPQAALILVFPSQQSWPETTKSTFSSSTGVKNWKRGKNSIGESWRGPAYIRSMTTADGPLSRFHLQSEKVKGVKEKA